MSEGNVQEEVHEEIDLTTEIMKTVKESVNTVISNMQAGLVKSITDAASKSMELNLKRIFVEEYNEAVTKKLKTENIPDLKRPGNKAQFKANNEILQKIENSLEAIDSNKLKKAKECLEEGKKLVLKRQKLIKIADREDDGWEVVKCYVSDDLASDSDDEKQLLRARKEAATRKKKAATKKSFTNSKFSKSFSLHSHRRNDERNNQNKNYSNTTLPRRDTKICYLCGKEGHFQFVCPLRKERN